MRRRLAVLACAAGTLALAPAASAARPLETAITDFAPYMGSDAPLAFKRTHDAGARAVRLFVSWDSIAPPGSVKPPGFDPSNPADPQYDWAELDTQVKQAVAAGLDPILSVEAAPDWAEGTRGSGDNWPPSTFKPDPAEFGRFAHALATRYSGSFDGLPRVRNFQAWNEPNSYRHLSPQFDTPSNSPTIPPNARLLSPDLYRSLVNAFSAAVHSVHGDNVVIAGGLAPFHTVAAQFPIIAPMRFMRALLCMSKSLHPLPGCAPIQFDVWSHHPYTSGGPTHHAAASDDVSLGDLPGMHRLLSAAVRARHVVSNGKTRFWVTEFSWDTDPPDRTAVPIRLHARWVAEALYRMWKAGVSLVTWFSLRDDPSPPGSKPGDIFQSGLYFRCSGGLACDRPKLSLTAFRFPFVAFREGGRILIWGRTPGGERGRVTVEQRSGRRWRRLASLRTDGSGIFTRRLRSSGRGDLRARLGSGRNASLPFSLKRPRDISVNPFGG